MCHVEQSLVAYLVPLVKLGALQEVQVIDTIVVGELHDGLHREGMTRAHT